MSETVQKYLEKSDESLASAKDDFSIASCRFNQEEEDSASNPAKCSFGINNRSDNRGLQTAGSLKKESNKGLENGDQICYTRREGGI